MTKRHQPSWLYEKKLTRLFEALDHNVRCVGGCVRNSLMGEPITDIDLATPDLPNEVIQKLNRQQIKTIPTGIDHGTITAIIDNTPYEITTLRSDTLCDGRHAKVQFSNSWEEDAKRRDFTINALSLDFEGNIYDYVDGLPDITSKQIRFIGDANERCKEDYLRILRFFRFHAYYGNGHVDTTSLQACIDHASGLEKLSGERIQKEMLTLLHAHNIMDVLTPMATHNLFSHIDMHVVGLEHIRQLIQLENKRSESISSIRRLAALVDYNHADKLADRWKLSKKDRLRLKLLCKPPADFVFPMKEANAKRHIRMMGKDMFHEQLLLLEAKLPASTSDFVPLWQILKNWSIPTFPVSGDDLMAIGVQGKDIGKHLLSAENWWEHNDYQPSKEDILLFLQQNVVL